MLAVGPTSENLGDPKTLVERRAEQLLTIPNVGLREALRPVADGFDESRHGCDHTGAAAVGPAQPPRAARAVAAEMGLDEDWFQTNSLLGWATAEASARRWASPRTDAAAAGSRRAMLLELAEEPLHLGLEPGELHLCRHAIADAMP